MKVFEVMQMYNALTTLPKKTKPLPVQMRFEIAMVRKSCLSLLSSASETEQELRTQLADPENPNEIAAKNVREFAQSMTKVNAVIVEIELPAPFKLDFLSEVCPDVTVDELMQLGPMLEEATYE
jgi:hypothetical protein